MRLGQQKKFWFCLALVPFFFLGQEANAQTAVTDTLPVRRIYNLRSPPSSNAKPGEIRFYDPNSEAGDHYFGVRASYSMSASYYLVWPRIAPNAGEFLKAVTADSLAWGTNSLSGVAVREVDLSPSVANITVIEVDQDDGLVITNPSGSITRLDLSSLVTKLGQTIESAEITDGEISNVDVSASANLSLSKLAAGTSAQIPVANSLGVLTYRTIGGDVGISDVGTMTISNSVISSAHIIDGVITEDDVNANIAGSGLVLTAGSPGTFDFAPSELTNITWSNGGAATAAWTMSLSGATDPVLNFGNNLLNVTNAQLQEDGANVFTLGDGALPIANGGTQTVTAPSDGKLLIGKTNGTYAVTNLTEGANITITNGDGTIMIAATGTGETNTASNLGGGLANFDSKVAEDLRFNTFAAADFDLAANVITIDDTKWAKDSELHAAMTLASDADVLLGLTAQQLTLDAQNANLIFAGPSSGGAADPTFRSLVDADIPNVLTLTDFTGATHTHQNSAGGGQLDHGLALTGLSDDDHTQYHLVIGRAGDAFIILPSDPSDGTHNDAPTLTYRAKYNPTGATGVTAKNLTLVHNVTDSETGASQLDFNFGGGVIATLSESSIGTVVGTGGTQTLTNKTINGASNTLTVVAGQYAAGSIVNADVSASAGIAPSKLANGSSAQILVANGSGVWTSVGMSGDGSISNAGALTVNDDSHVHADGTIANDLTLATVSGAIDAGAATSLEVPNGAAPTVDVFGEIAGDNNLWASGRGSLVTFDGTAATALIGALVSDTPGAGEVPKFNADGTITWESDNTGGAPAWSSLAAPTGATSFVSDGTSETFTIDFQAAFTTGSQFVLKQSTGNPSSGILADIQTADADVTPFRLTAQGTSNGVQMNASGVLAPIGTGQINANRFNGASGALTDDDLSNNNFDDLADVTITSAAAAHLIVRNSGNTAWVNVALSGDGSIDATGALVVNNDSHAHTGSTLSGIDVSDDLNLLAGTNITLTGDQIDVDDAFVLNTGDAIVGNLDFNDGAGNTPQALFTPQTGTAWALYVVDSDDDLQIEVNTASTETFEVVNVGAGVVNLSVDGSLTASNLSNTNSGDVTLAGESYLSLASQVLTANPVNLSGTHVTGTLAAARFPALTGHVTTTAGNLATTVANSVITAAMMANGDHGVFTYSGGAATLDASSVSGGSGGVVTDNSLTSDDLGTNSVGADELAADAQLWNEIGDPGADAVVALSGFETDLTSTIDTADKAVLTITNTDADAANDNSLLDLRHNDGADANVFYLRMIGDNDGTPTNDFLFSQAGFTSLLPVNVPAEAYDAAGWNGDPGAPRKDDVRDEMELKLYSSTAASTYAPLASPTFTGTVTIPTPFTLGAVSVLPTGTELNFVDGVTSAIQTQLDGKQASDADLTDLADGSLTGTKVGFADTDNNFTATDVQSAIEELDDVINGGVPNSASAKVDWSELANVPAGFADGSDADAATAWDAIADAAGNGSVGFGDTEQIIVSSQTSGDVAALTLDINQADDAAATDDLIAFSIDGTSESGDAGDTFTLMRLLYENGTANTVLDRALLIDNAETTASTMTDAILITSSGVNDGVVDAIDASAANITNALNIGANNIVTSGATISSAELDRLDGLSNTIVTDATAVTDVDGAGLVIGSGILAIGAGTAITVNANDVAVTADGIGPTQLDETANYAFSGAVTATGNIQFDGDALRILDTGADHYLTITPGTNLTANRALTITTGDAARTLTFAGDATISGTNSGDQTITLTGDVTGSGPGSFAATIANDAVTNAKSANMAQNTIKMRVASGSGDTEDIDISSGLSLVTAASGDFIIIEDATDGGLKRIDAADFLSGGASWSSLTAPSGAVSMVSDGTSETATFDFQAAFTTGNQFTVKQTTGNPTGGSLFALQAVDADVSPIAKIENTAAVTIAVGLQIAVTNASGVLTTALDLSDAEIVTALALGSNDVTVGGVTVSSSEFAVLDGAIDLSGAEATGTLAADRFPALTGDVTTSAGSVATAIGADKITEAMLKSVDTAVDEDILTYESTTGDFEWHTPANLGLATLASPAFTGTPTIANGATSSGNFQMFEDSDNGSNKITVQAPAALAADATWQIGPQHLVVAFSDESTALTTGTAKITFRFPCKATIVDLRASLKTASSSGTPTFDINETGTTIISTKLTIDANETTSTTAAAAYALSDANIADDAEMTIDIDTAGTGAIGGKIIFYYYPVP